MYEDVVVFHDMAYEYECISTPGVGIESEWITPIATQASKIVIMECIPYLSKDKKEIYEGDVLATGFTPEHTKSIVRIGEARLSINEYSADYYGIYLEGSVDLEDYLFRGEMYTVGNIYESPTIMEYRP